MCSIDAHEKEHQVYCDDGSSGGGRPLPSNSTTEAPDSLGATIDFIGCWLKALEYNFIEYCSMYVFNMKIVFQKILVELTKQSSPKKTQIIITCYLRWLVCEQIRSEATTTKGNEIKQKIPKRGRLNKKKTNSETLKEIHLLLFHQRINIYTDHKF